ncbi:dihydroorotase [Nonlabens arenilitoris]|uniref:Dihydroorotase n=1 Tax=Nonlabens arenilitoris TaxID=1217969 RepID=A0A2S7UDD2_9FLAO|nr:dihydroorotase [Nonlabens arenilitoris]PQJ32630.1 dihydroorotase [Nonlabens arenilitoris]
MILLKNVTIIDAGSDLHLKKRDLLIKNGRISQIAASIKNDEARIISKEDLHISIGWFDSSVSFGEPGFEERQTLKNGLEATAKSGFTTIMLNPNNRPNPQDESGINYLKNKTAGEAVTLLPVGNFTLNQDGEHLAELYDMQKAGAISFYDFKKSISNTNLLKVGLQYVKSFGGIIQSYPQDNHLAGKGMVNEDAATIHLGIKTTPAMAEEVQIARDIQVAAYTGARLHIPTITTAASVQLIKDAKKKYSNITCSVSTNHLFLDTTDLADFNTHFKIEPPLRDEKQKNILINALKSGIIDTVTSDHIPLNIEHKAVEFDQASYGSIGLESAFGILQTLLDTEKAIEALTSGYQVFGIKKPQIKVDEIANLSLFVPTEKYTFEKEYIFSSSKNSAILNKKLRGKALGIINNKKIVWNG